MNSGQIIKSRTAGDFTQIPNSIAKSDKLSLEEKGLLLHLLSLPPDWVIYRENLYTQINDSKNAIDRTFRKLQDLGYILSIKQIDDKGKFTGWNHIVYDKPTTETEFIRGRENPMSDLSEVGKTAPILNTNTVLNTNTILNTNTLYSFRKLFDEIYINQLKSLHNGKDIEEAIKQAYGHLIADPERLAKMSASDCKRFLNSWLSNSHTGGPAAKVKSQYAKKGTMTDIEFLSKIK